MKLREKENKLFEEWSKNRKKFAKDGAGKKFESQKTKLILIGKETNKTGNNFDWREYLDGGVFYKKTNKPFATSYNLYRWAKFLLESPLEWKEYKKIEKNKEKRIDIFSKIVFMNVKKESGGSISDTNKIIKTGSNDEKYLEKQLELYLDNNDLKILFLLGNGIYTPIKKIIQKKYTNIEREYLNKSRFIETYNNNLFVVKFYHFNRCALDKSYKLIQKIYNIIKIKQI